VLVFAGDQEAPRKVTQRTGVAQKAQPVDAAHEVVGPTEVSVDKKALRRTWTKVRET